MKNLIAISFLILGLSNSVFASANCTRAQAIRVAERCENWSPAGSRSYVQGSCKNTPDNNVIYKCMLRDGTVVVGVTTKK